MKHSKAFKKNQFHQIILPLVISVLSTATLQLAALRPETKASTLPIYPVDCNNFTNTNYKQKDAYTDKVPEQGTTMVTTFNGTIIANETTYATVQFSMYQGNILIQKDKKNIFPPIDYLNGQNFSAYYAFTFPQVVPSDVYSARFEIINEFNQTTACWDFPLAFPASEEGERDFEIYE